MGAQGYREPRGDDYHKSATAEWSAQATAVDSFCARQLVAQIHDRTSFARTLPAAILKVARVDFVRRSCAWSSWVPLASVFRARRRNRFLLLWDENRLGDSPQEYVCVGFHRCLPM